MCLFVCVVRRESKQKKWALLLFISEGYAALRKIVGRHLYLDFVAGQNLDVVHTHLAWDVGCDFVSVLKFDAEHCVGECFDDGSVKFDCSLFCHIVL